MMRIGIMRLNRNKTEIFFLLVLVLAVPVVIPLASADGKNISINITSPEEGDIIFFDIVPAYIAILGTIDAPQGIRNVSITNGLTDEYGEVVCGNNLGIRYDISCKILITDHVTVTVTDNLGSVVSETRNFTSYAGPPPPGTIWVTGWVVDPKGQPVPDASIIFERMGENTPVVVLTKTGVDGRYKMKKANGFFQKVTVQKEGYQTIVHEMTFKEYNNELNITLIPQERSVIGFDFTTARVPLVSAVEKNININITSPEEGDIFYIDVVPAFITVQGTIDAPQGIRTVSITNGGDHVVCGSNYGTHFDILCDVPCYSGSDHITVSVVDKAGNSASATHNFTRYTGPPPPGTIWVYGNVVDTNGDPISNAVLTFETEKGYGIVSVNTTTDKDGKYSMKKANGFQQKITVRKAGYETIVQEVTFEPYGHDVNFTLSPQKMPVSGFSFALAACAIMLILMIAHIRRER